VLVAGGATGIGLAVVRALRRRGDQVLLADMNVEAAQRAATETLPGRCVAVACDLSSEDAPRDAVQAVIDHFGGVDVVFGNAGVLLAAPLEDWTIEAWELTMHVNLRAPFLLAQAAARHLEASPIASLIFTASTGAFRGSAEMPAYGASKAGLVNLVRSLAAELSPRGIRVNAICPGWIDTPFNEPYWRAQENPKAALRALLHRIPLGRQGSPDEVAELVLFLASPLSRYITGQAIVIDGGYTAV